MKLTDPPATAFDSGNATADRDASGKFITANRSSRGRPKGSRVKLAENVVSDVLDSWREHGPVALARVACLDPGKYLDFIAKVLPREVKLEISTPTDGMTDEQLQEMLAFANAKIAEAKARGDHAKPVTVIEAQVQPFGGPPPPTSAEQRASAQRRDMLDQHDAPAAAAPALPSQALPHPVGRAVPVSAREEERRNIAKLTADDIDPASLF